MGGITNVWLSSPLQPNYKAAWCSYKYLNSGPGGIAGIFVHDKHDAAGRHRLAGWWGHDKATRFDMDTSMPFPLLFSFWNVHITHL